MQGIYIINPCFISFIKSKYFKRISAVASEAYVKRRDRIKSRIAKNRIANVNQKENDVNKQNPTPKHHPAKLKRRLNPSTRIVPTHNHTKLKPKKLSPGTTLKVEEWTEKLLEEARDSLELIDVSVQTETFNVASEDLPVATATEDKSSQTEEHSIDENFKVRLEMISDIFSYFTF